MSWGQGVDPTSVFGQSSFEEALAESGEQEEGQGLYPELEDFMKSFGGTPASGEGDPAVKFKAVHYDCFNIMMSEQKARLEELSTRLAQGEDCILCNEETTFTKEGYYVVVIKWAEYSLEKPQEPVHDAKAE